MSDKRIESGIAFIRALPKAMLGLFAVTGLFAASAQSGFSDGYKFLEAIKKKEGEKVEQALMESSTIIDARDVTSGETGVYIVVSRRDIVWLRYLVQHKANVNIGNNRGQTPLQQAVALGWREGVEFLVANGAATDTSDDAGETPLISAVHRRDTQMMRVLLQAGADADRSDNSGRSARDYAMLDGPKGTLMTTIETYAKKQGGAKAKPVYGPSL